MDFFVGVRGDKEDVAAGNLVFAIGRGEIQEELVETELEAVFIERGAAVPLTVVEGAGFEIVDFDGLGGFVEVDVVDFAGQGDAVET